MGRPGGSPAPGGTGRQNSKSEPLEFGLIYRSRGFRARRPSQVGRRWNNVSRARPGGPQRFPGAGSRAARSGHILATATLFTCQKASLRRRSQRPHAEVARLHGRRAAGQQEIPKNHVFFAGTSMLLGGRRTNCHRIRRRERPFPQPARPPSSEPYACSS